MNSRREREPQPIVIFGAGGLAREVEWLIRRVNAVNPRWSFKGFVVSDLGALGPRDSADQVVGDEEWLFGQHGLSVALGIGNPVPRVAVARRLATHFGDECFPALIDPTAVFDDQSCTIEPGVILLSGVTMTVRVRLGKFVCVNPGCTIGHEATIGAGSVLNPSASISGGVDLGAGCQVGTGARILQYLTVGDGARIGAGAVVTKDVPHGQTWVGVPARPVR